ncbi:MAG: pyridoxal-phosphate dependent enzyme [Saprospiraceae bacterium]|nr:pyridoxal-phosphate dependent enzyme [Saprospiraceae bacterium]
MNPKIDFPVLLPSPIQKIVLPVLREKRLEMYVKRDDLIHPWVSGNKWRKLSLNLDYVIKNQIPQILTYGGAFSNHLYATAGAGALLDLETIGIIRGDGFDNQNPTLKFCEDRNMKMHFVSRSAFKDKENDSEITRILELYPEAYILPEGGTNPKAIEGAGAIIEEIKIQMHKFPDFVAVASGTGGTAAGLMKVFPKKSKLMVFSALKSGYLQKEILKLAEMNECDSLIFFSEYHFGGYAKWNNILLDFIKEFESKTSVPVDHVYNGKLLFGIIDLIEKDFFPRGSTLLWIHTGGLQGKEGLKYMSSEMG